MAKLKAYALKNPKTDTIVPGSLIFSNVKPVSGDWFPVVEGIERNFINPVSYDTTVKIT